MKERRGHIFMQRQDVKGGKSTQGCGQQAAAPPRTALQQSFSGNLSHYFTALSVYFVGTKWIHSYIQEKFVCPNETGKLILTSKTKQAHSKAESHLARPIISLVPWGSLGSGSQSSNAVQWRSPQWEVVTPEPVQRLVHKWQLEVYLTPHTTTGVKVMPRDSSPSSERERGKCCSLNPLSKPARLYSSAAGSLVFI